MIKHFEILFLDEAFEFLNSLERKHYEKILYNIRKSQVELDAEFLKNFRKTYGNLERCIRDSNIDYLPFGTRHHQLKPWLFRHTDLPKKEAKFQTMKFKKRLILGQNT